ncbi:protein phosphatase CheZ [Coralliovum pocilloporae]|uniref:protein phosphatase CheZ n=1 Tax=Coralliovum pocilloporae TaxID=3066369 RepID=UPI00330788C1
MSHYISTENVDSIVSFLERDRAGDVSLNDVIQLAEVMAGSLHSYFESLDISLYEEFKGIADEISVMKTEVANLRPSDMRENRIPEAGRELDAVVNATEQATETIMAAAEDIMATEATDLESYQAHVNDKMIEVFEACSFQDITGQRISKVVETINHIDERISNFIDRLKVAEVADAEVEETEEERRRRELILHGPQHAGEGVAQDDVDQLFDAVEADGVDQDEIDKLFG